MPQRPRTKNERRGGRERAPRTREPSEWEQRVVDMRRTARVVAGGRRFSFRATVVVGDRKGRVGVGVGKGAEVAKAVEKAANRAKKSVIRVAIVDKRTIGHDVTAKFSAARIVLRPARPGHGLVAGGPIRVVAMLAGIKDLTAKIVSRSPNKLNNALAAVEALKKLKMPESKHSVQQVTEAKV